MAKREPEVVIDALGKEAARVEEDCTYSSKGHYNVADSWGRRHLLLGIPATVLGAVASLLIKSCPEVATVAAAGATILTGLVTFLKPNERAAAHKAAAGQYQALRNDARLFREIEAIESDDAKTLSTRLKELAKRRNNLNQNSPGIPESAFQKARRGIVEGEATYEIDKSQGE